MKNNTKKTLKIYWQACWHYKTAGFFMVLCIVAASVVEVIVPLYLKEFLDILANSQAVKNTVGELIRILIIIGGLYLVSWLFWRAASFTTTYFQSNIITLLDRQSFNYLHKHSFAFFNDNFVGSLVKRVKWFSRAFEVIADRITWDLVPLVVNISLVVFVLAKRNMLLGAVMLGWTALFLAVNFVFTRYKLKYDIERAAKDTEVTGLLADTITNQSNVKLFNGYKGEVKWFRRKTGEAQKIRSFTWNLNNIFDAVQGAFIVAIEVGILYVAVRLWQRNALTVGDFILIQAYLINVVHRVWNFGRVVRSIYESLADAEEMTIILNTPYEIQDVLKAKKLKVEKGKIEFKDVEFCYRQTRKVLEKFNLVIEPGEKVALVGPSGAGKSTIVKLLLRMHDVTAGKILIDNQEIAKVTGESLKANISLVPQDPILFHRSLMENIRYGKPKVTNKEVIMAAKKAHCHEFIVGFDEGYNTLVGERGLKLSGGERQRVAIARAILRAAPILVLDEATSSLDSASERLIQDALDELMTQKTVIAIAHRLSTIRKMDRIIVIDEGQIIEEGTHSELITRPNGRYKKLWELQAGGFIK